MRSYEAARGLFSFLGFCSWVIIGLGVLVVLFAIGAAAEMSSPVLGRSPGPGAMVVAAVPGAAPSFVGVIALALAQMGRASVDSAEYAQQSLQIAREQLEISRQNHGQLAAPASFATVAAEPEPDQPAPETDGASFANLPEPEPEPEAELEPPALPEEPAVPPTVGDTIEHLGQRIVVSETGFDFDGMRFQSLEGAKAFIDQHRAGQSS